MIAMADQDSRAGKRYTTEAILDWTAQVHAAHDPALTRAFTTPEGIPAIMVGPSEGRLLELLARLVNATKIVEVGTLLGYSALRLARGMAPGGHLWTIEYDSHHAELARGNLAAAGLADQVTVVTGAGLEILPTLDGLGPFDLVFIDADKANYHHYGRWALEQVRPGGLIVGDNAFLFGELLDDSERGQAMREFHEQLARRSLSVCVPTPDGVVVAMKL
jgi:caffeoyl-CoA O-methyltransferase